MALQAPLFDAAGKSNGSVDLPETLFAVEGSRYTLHEVIIALRRNQRKGTSMTKTRGLVSGGGRKPWKQKGTGNARAGSIRSPLWRKGGIVFGPVPRSHYVRLDAAKKNLAILTALSEKAKAGQISVLDSVNADLTKTSQAAGFIKDAALSQRTLLIVDKAQPSFLRAIGNIPWLEVIEAAQVNAWAVMRARKIVLLRAALDTLQNRFPKG